MYVCYLMKNKKWLSLILKMIIGFGKSILNSFIRKMIPHRKVGYYVEVFKNKDVRTSNLFSIRCHQSDSHWHRITKK